MPMKKKVVAAAISTISTNKDKNAARKTKTNRYQQ
jgi:hypothetical protein